MGLCVCVLGVTAQLSGPRAECLVSFQDAPMRGLLSLPDSLRRASPEGHPRNGLVSALTAAKP